MKERKYLTLDPMGLTQRERHGYLLSAVAPRPIAFASTIDKEGRVNLSPFSFFNVFSSNPPIMVFSPSRKGTDNSTKDTHHNVLDVPEVVINIVNYPIVEQMSLSSTAYEQGVNEFVKSGLTEIPSDIVAPPRVAESPVAFECKVDDVISLGDQGGAGNLVICRVVKMHIDTAVLNEDQRIDTQKMDLVARMGGMWYTKASGATLFEIPKPLRAKGIGVDALPEHARMSNILTGNDLGRLGNISTFPDDSALAIAKEKLSAEPKVDDTLVHLQVHTMLQEGKTEEALALLFAYTD